MSSLKFSGAGALLGLVDDLLYGNLDLVDGFLALGVEDFADVLGDRGLVLRRASSDGSRHRFV